MEILHELLPCLFVTVFLSLLTFFVINKLLAMECSRDLSSKKGKEPFVFEEKTLSSEESQTQTQTQTLVDEVETSGSPLLSNEKGLLELVDLKEEGLNIEETDSAYHVFDESPVLCEEQVVREIEIESVGVANLMDLDDWEGIERSELEKKFGDAMVFVEESTNLENDVKLQLYGLSKIVLDGPCISPQPMALMITARAKWNAWQQLMDMNRETAMEQYISLLSKSIPDWKERAVNEECK